MNKTTNSMHNFNIKNQLNLILDTFKNEPLQFIETPFEPLNELLNGGLKCGFTYVIGGATGIGKTALLTQFAEAAAIQKHPVFYYSLEIIIPDFIARLISKNTVEIAMCMDNCYTSAGALTQFAIENQAINPLTSKEEDVYNLAVNRVKSYSENLYLFNDINNFNVHTIIKQLEEWQEYQKENNFIYLSPLLIIDYLQLLKTGDSKFDSDQKACVGECQRILNNYCKRNGITVVYISSLNRMSCSAKGTININSFKENGDIEYNNDGAMLLTVDEVDTEYNISYQKLSLVKGRGANQGEIDLINLYPFNYYMLNEQITSINFDIFLKKCKKGVF